MVLAKFASRTLDRVRRLLNWDAMPLAVRGLVGVLLLATLVETVHLSTP